MNMKWIKASERLPPNGWYGAFKHNWPDDDNFDWDTGNRLGVEQLLADSDFINVQWLDESTDESDMDGWSDQDMIDIIEWFDNLSPARKCTVHPPVGSGAGYGIYNLPYCDFLEMFRKYKNKILNK